MPDPRPCETHLDIFKFQRPLIHFAEAVKRQTEKK